MSLRGGSQKDRKSEVSRGNRDDRRKKQNRDEEGSYFHNYDDEDDDAFDSDPYRRRDNRPRYDRPNDDRIYDDISDDSRRSDGHFDNRPRRPKGSDRDRGPSDRRRPRDDRNRGYPDRRGDRGRSSPDGDDDRRYSPPRERGEISDRHSPERQGHPRQSQLDRYDDPWDIPKNREKGRRPPYASEGDRNSPLDKRKDRGRHSPPHGRSERRNSPPDRYEDPWDSHGKKDSERRVPSDNSLDESHEDYTPRYYDQIANPPSSGKDTMETERNTRDKEKNGLEHYRDENGHVTVDLGPGVYRPVRLEAPPPHYSRSKDNTPYRSQGSKLDGSQPPEDDDKGKIDYGEDENEERGNWSGKFDFILSMLGYAVGLGNVWRFPYLCYRNGGGAFLFPFLLMMVIIGLPLFYLEAALGQFSSCGAMTCWNFAPIFKGLGIAMVMVSAMTGIYYNMILGWSLHYMFSSFTSDLPFASCENDWNTHNCKLKLPIMKCEGDAQSDDGRCLDGDGNEIGLWNKTLFTEVTGRTLQSPAQEYWERYVLHFSDGIEYFGQPKWDLVLCLLLAWVICFLCLIKGIKTTGKVVYFTAIFPYVVLLILFFRGVTLENASIGVKYFITPNFERLGDANVWKDAANQIFFSMSIAGGGLITLSSYNRFHNNILRDSLIVAIGDSFTCVLGGFVIFSYLGYMAGQLDVGIEEVAADGAGLAFVVYPEAVSNLPPPTLWALLFFFMLLLLGLDSQFAMIETVLTGVLDQYPRYRPKKTLVIAIICTILFILGLPLTCPGGMYLLQLMDNYVGGMTLIIIGFVEILAVVFIYGVKRFCQDINLMTGSTRFLFWKVTWCVLSPLTIVFIFVFMFIDYKASKYDDYTYPAWADVIGWFFTMASVLAIPIVMIFKISREIEGKNAWQKLRLLCLPSVYWGPALKKHRVLVDYVDGFQVDPYKGLQPRTTFVNYGFDNSTETSLKAESKNSLGASRISVISSLSRATVTTARSEKSGVSFETNV